MREIHIGMIRGTGSNIAKHIITVIRWNHVVEPFLLRDEMGQDETVAPVCKEQPGDLHILGLVDFKRYLI